MAYLVASVITMAAQDLVTIYLPLLGAEKNINVRDIGSLLTVRSVAALVSRMGYVRIIALVGRRPLTLASMVGSAIGFACLALPVKLAVLFAAMTLTGVALGNRDDVEPYQRRRSRLAGVDGHRHVAAQHRQPDRSDGGAVRREPDRRRQPGSAAFS